MSLPFLATFFGSAAAGPLLPIAWTVAKLVFRAVRAARRDDKPEPKGRAK